jgi:hypothetical protein
MFAAMMAFAVELGWVSAIIFGTYLGIDLPSIILPNCSYGNTTGFSHCDTGCGGILTCLWACRLVPGHAFDGLRGSDWAIRSQHGIPQHSSR